MKVFLHISLVLFKMECCLCLLLLPFGSNFNRPFKRINSNRNSSAVNVLINLPILNSPIKLSVNNSLRDKERYNKCEDKFVFESDGEVLKARSKPKGLCRNCCDIAPSDIAFTVHKTDNSTTLYQSEIGARPLDLLRDVPTIVYIHGFLESPPLGSTKIVINALMSLSYPMNLISMDWSELCTFPWYFNAIENTRIAGKVLAKFLKVYKESEGIDERSLHLIGFSLGAHVAGYASKYLKGEIKISRITALDPALPGFQGVGRLSKDDADFVDVIHTDGGNFGILQPLGHIDFYPNGGTYFQPGCQHRDLAKRNQLMNTIACSHQRAYHYFSESVTSPLSFPAVKCTWGALKRSCDVGQTAPMGFAASPQYPFGSYYLKTNKDSPYGRTTA